MARKIRERTTYANVVATLALFVALGGSSYAAITITGRNVKDSSLTGRDIKNSSLTTSDVKNKSLLARDFKAGQLPLGPQGLQGAKGEKGDRGAPGVPAAKLFAYVRDTGSADAATLQYGPGATGVDDPDGQNDLLHPYTVHFNRSLSGCVAHVTGGQGAGIPGSFSPAIPLAVVNSTSVDVALFEVQSGSLVPSDESFMLSVLC